MAMEDNDAGFQQYLREIAKFPLLTVEEERCYAARIAKGDVEAKAYMVCCNLRLVVKIARDYSNYGVPLLDLISEGSIGLINAVGRFDPKKGGKLSTYAAWWIKQSIKKALGRQSKTIRLPVHFSEKISRIRKVSRQLSEGLGREPTDEEVADELGIGVSKVARLKLASLRPASLDASVGEDDDTELIDLVGDMEAQDPFEMLSDKNLHQELGVLLVQLSERERKILSCRFGLDGARPKTLEEVGEKFGVTRERVRQVQNIALTKLRRGFRKKEKSKVLAMRGKG